MDKSRRTFFIFSALMGLVFALPPRLRAFVMDTFPVRTVEKDNFRFDPRSGKIKWKDRDEPYALEVTGMVDKPFKLSYRELRALPQIAQTSDFHCVEGWDVEDVKWGGFRFSEVIGRAHPRPGAAYAVFHALGQTSSSPGGFSHYVESHPVSYLTDPSRQCLMALDMGGKPLEHDHGAPMRVIAPFSLGYKNIKYVTRIEFASKPQDGWWTMANPVYNIDAPVEDYRLRKK